MRIYKPKIYIYIFLSIFLLSCGKSNDQIDYDDEIKVNKTKFYYPHSYDDLWRTYNPKLVGSDGWIKRDCDEKDLNERINVKVISQNLNHKGWGKYEGKLKVKKTNSNLIFEINFECFTPNYKIGEWLK